MNSGSSRAGRRFQLVFFLVFAVIPSFLAYIGWTFYREQRIAAFRNDSIPDIRRELLRLRREGDDRLHIQRRINFLYGNMAEENFDEATIEANLNRFREEGFGFVNFRFFKEDGSSLSIKGQSESRRAVLQKIFEALLLQETTGDGSLLQRNRPFFDALVGGITPSAIAQDKSSLLRVMMNGRPGYFYWNTIYSPEPSSKLRGGLVAWFREADIPNNMALGQLLDQINAEWQGQRVYGLIDLASSTRSLPAIIKTGAGRFSPAVVASHLVRLRNQFQSQSELSGHLLVSEFFTPDRVLFCLDRLPHRFYNDVSTMLKIFIIIWLLLVSRAGAGFSVSCRQESPDMMKQTVCFGLTQKQFFVMFAAVLPVLTILMIGCNYRDAFAKMLTQEAFSGLTGKIERVDENYQVAVRNLEHIYRRVARLPEVRALDTAAIDKLADELRRKDAINRLYIADRSGRMRYSWPTGKNSGDVTARIMPAISRRIFITQRGDEESFQDKVSDMMMDSFADSFSDMLGDTGTSLLRTFENLDQVNEFWLANRRHYVYTSFVERGTEKDPWLLYIWHGTVSFAQRYLQRQIQRNVDEQNDLDSPIRLAMVPRERSELPFPRDFNKYPFVAQLSDQVVSTEIQQNLISSMAGEKWLIAAAPLKRVPAYLVFAMYPYRIIEQQTFALSMMIYLAALLCLVAAIALTTVIDDL